jgi:sulfhydrogenase subunit gamma (sulfur reductase)
MNALTAQKLDAASIYMPWMLVVQDTYPLTEYEKLIRIELPFPTSLNHKPGQFVEVSLLGQGEAPISISSSPSRSVDSFELCVRRAGRLTQALHRLVPGDQVGVRGPYGRGLPLDRFRGKDILFAPGGLGLAPLRSAINEVLDDRNNYGCVTILYGARSPAELLFRDELEQWAGRGDVEVHLTVDTADKKWKGHTGVITTLFPSIRVSPRNTVAITCGPPVMYRFVLMELLGKGIPEGNIWFSLERRMKCGVGKCGHCQIDHIYTCQEGPVFSYAEVKHLREAL